LRMIAAFKASVGAGENDFGHGLVLVFLSGEGARSKMAGPILTVLLKFPRMVLNAGFSPAVRMRWS
jgi:hypothetical protein